MLNVEKHYVLGPNVFFLYLSLIPLKSPEQQQKRRNIHFV